MQKIYFTMNRFQERKLVESLAYLVGKLELSDVKAYKLLWLSDRLHLGRYARTITGDEYYAMERGPVPSNLKKMVNHKPHSKVFDSFFEVENKMLRLISSPEKFDFLSETDKSVLDEVVAVYGGYTEDALINMSHFSPEWDRFREKLQNGKKKSYKMMLDDFFYDFADPESLFVRHGEPEIAKSVYHCD